MLLLRLRLLLLLVPSPSLLLRSLTIFLFLKIMNPDVTDTYDRVRKSKFELPEDNPYSPCMMHRRYYYSTGTTEVVPH